MIFTSDKLAIAYDDEGEGQAVLLIHGHPFNRSMWRPQIQALKSSCRVVAPDLRGYGDSTYDAPSHETRLEVFAADLLGLLDHLEIERAVLVGLSMGGQIVMEILRTNPNRASGAVLAATFAEAETPEGAVQRNHMADRLLREGMARPGTELLPKFLGQASMARMPDLALLVYGMITSTSPQAAAAALRGRARRPDYRPTLKALDLPTLIVCGSDDSYTSVATANGLQGLIKGSVLEVIESCGHLPNLEYPERFNRVLKAFLTRIGAARNDRSTSA